MAIMAIIWSVFTFVTGLGKSFFGVIVPRFVVGVGEAGFTSAANAMVSAAYPQESRAKMLGILHAFSPIGAAVGMIMGGYISTNYGGWRTPFYVFAILGILFGVPAFFLKDYKTVKDIDHTGKQRGFFSSFSVLFKIPTLPWVYLGYGLRQILTFSIFVWLPTYLMRSQGISEAKAGMTTGIVLLMGIIGAPLGGFLADLWQSKNPRGRLYLCALAEILSALIWVVALILNVSGIGFIVGLVCGVVVLSTPAPLFSVTQDVVTPAHKGISTGMAMLCMYALGGGWAPVIVGLISDALGGTGGALKTALAIVAIPSILAAICFQMASKHYPDDVDKVKGAVLEAEK